MCDFGGGDFSQNIGNAYSTTFNTIGVGDVVSPGQNNGIGSGDRFDNKRAKKHKLSVKRGPVAMATAKGIPAPRPLIVYTKKKK